MGEPNCEHDKRPSWCLICQDRKVAQLEKQVELLKRNSAQPSEEIILLRGQVTMLRRELDGARELRAKLTKSWESAVHEANQRAVRAVAAARADERARVEAEVVAWLRRIGEHAFDSGRAVTLADRIECGEHRPATKEGT